jgi:hypothetical protein
VEREPVTRFDPDLDASNRPIPSVPPHRILESQRLVANPFLAIAGWILGVVLMRWGLASVDVRLYLFGFAFLILPFGFFQYHCLDCGATGSFYRARRHICPAILTRALGQTRRRNRVPRLSTQLKGWFFAIALIALAYYIHRYR